MSQDDIKRFLKTCKRKLKMLPTEACVCGKPEFNEKNNLKNKKKLCPWYINSSKHNYCFWKYVIDCSDEKGRMPTLCYREIGEYLGISSSTVGITIRNCLNKFKESNEFKDINDLSEKGGSSEADLDLILNQLEQISGNDEDS